jgi:hypothetical protein
MLAVLGTLPLTLAAAPADPPPAVPAAQVQLRVLDPAGRLAACQSWKLHGGLAAFGSYAHSPLHFEGPQGPVYESLSCDSAECRAGNGGEPVVIFPCDFSIYVRSGSVPHQTLGWDEPAQQLFCASFPDGTRAVLRLPEAYQIGSGSFSLGGQTAQLEPYSPAEYAALQLSGEPVPDLAELQAEWSMASWVSTADCHSLLASTTGTGRAEALLLAAEAVTHMLDEYQREHQTYPASLDQLWQGANAVAPISPGNPYDWPAPLCMQQPPVTGGHGLVYWQRAEGKGYLLGVVGDGPAALPPDANGTPANLPAAVAWFSASTP